jgi:2-keto-4-pentenoate hydratase/2-oxohepta-3-ene-1,7-dioic acid hydratase in catechol pathway
VSYTSGPGAAEAGVIVDRVVVPVARYAEQLGIDPDGHRSRSMMRSLLAADGALRRLAGLATDVASNGAAEGIPLGDIELAPPVPDPDKIICVGANYRAHAEESGLEPPTIPILFSKYRNTLIGAGAPIELPEVSDEIDYEGELAVVIGRSCKSVSEAEALDYVGGYTAFNDVSARDVQLRTSQWMAGKSLDTFGPCGPVLVTPDEIPDPQALQLETRLNGETVQRASTGGMIFRVATLIAHLSSLMTLEPGDIIATGTPEGVGFTRKPPLFMVDGDDVEVEIERIGLLRNPVIGKG